MGPQLQQSGLGKMLGKESLKNQSEFEKFLHQSANLVSLSPDEIQFAMNFTDKHTNSFGSIHGGILASMFDQGTSIALMVLRKKLGVSVSLQVNYISPTYPGDKVVLLCKVVKVGRLIAHTSAEMRNADSNQLIATAVHIKSVASTGSSATGPKKLSDKAGVNGGGSTQQKDGSEQRRFAGHAANAQSNQQAARQQVHSPQVDNYGGQSRMQQASSTGRIMSKL